MPWTVDDPPSVAKNWTSGQKKKCVAAANAVLEDGGSEEDAIYACINAAGKSKKRSKNSMSQKQRSDRYGIEVLETGNEDKPAAYASLPDSQWGDPVNYLYPVADAPSAEQATRDFRLNRDAYESGLSSKIVRGRINRLARKYEVKPVKASQPDPDKIGHFLVGEIKLAEPDDTAHKGLLKIPAARVALMEHPWWGAIHLDADLFESFIDNWQTNVVGYDLAVDPDHDPHQGALAWVKDITFADKEFALWVEPTAAGEGVLGDVWRYASIEYTEDYKDPETGVSYGATLLGCGATNRPFVHRQDAIQVLSQDVLGAGEVPEGASFVLINNQEVTEMNVTYDDGDDIVQEPVDTVEPSDVELSQPEPAQPVEPVAKSDPTPAPASTPAPPAVQALGQPVDGQAIQFADGTVITAAQVAEILQANARLAERDHTRTVEEACEKALARGVAPVVVNTAKQIMLATSPSADPTITLSVPGEEGKEVDKSLNLFSAVAELLSLVPGRITEMPLSYAHTEEVPAGGVVASTNNPYADQKPLTPEEAEQAAIERRKELGIRYSRMAGDPGVAL